MELKDILKKITEGKELSADEKAFIAKYEEPSQTDRIPKERLDREIAKRKEAETKLAEQNANIAELNSRIEEIEAKGLPEKDKLAKESAKLAKQLADLAAERDTFKAELDSTRFGNSVAKFAGEHSFTDQEYLGYMLKTKKIATDDTEAVKAFMGELKKTSPKLFKAEGSPGGDTPRTPTGGSPNPGANAKFEEAKKSGDMAAMLANAPEIKTETKK